MAAAMFAALTIYVLRSHGAAPERDLLCTALFFTAFWGLHTAFRGVSTAPSGISESLRNGGWLLFMFVMLRRGEGRRSDHPASITIIYAILGTLLLAQIATDEVEPFIISGDPDASAMLGVLLRMMFAVGALVLVHHLFTISAPEGRSRIALVMAALAAMWTYDLNLYTLAALARGSFGELYAMRGIWMALLAVVLAIGVRHGGEWRLRVSRTVAFRSFSLVAVSLYLIVMAAGISVIEWLFGSHARVVETGILFATLVASLVLLPSNRFRSALKVQISKHFFQHRYDYRIEWIRFIDTIGAPGSSAAPLNERAVKAVADLTDSSCGMLLLHDGQGGLGVDRIWSWPTTSPSHEPLNAEDASALERSGWIIDLDEARSGHGPTNVPSWMLADTTAWALVPLIHFGRLTGAIVLGRPSVNRRLDWEDLDMLRAAGRQVASYISEAQGQQALEDSRRFDEFNRRFAFIIHDVKNLVSQLSLLSRNAERHADNPAFRKDMILTLGDSVGKLNDLLARLSQHNKARKQEPIPVDLEPIVRKVAATQRHHHPVEVTGMAACALADPQRLEQILLHLVQNAIDASSQGEPIRIDVEESSDFAVVTVSDSGCGMSAEFVRRDLFKPFNSTKSGGFGIGAFEARELAHAMGGRIEVESRLGQGSSFALHLPIAPENKGAGRLPNKQEKAA
ncbi:MAG: PEP-CTERM system histidine kinase PrsK [Sphingobium sp.]|nr:XrtA/PEP-CTERM system histidine kinase PrsK [Sphingobium sp.]MDX3908463.1 PEP-CTERM system histidine kinase PrsK [Sphingobium sp.]